MAGVLRDGDGHKKDSILRQPAKDDKISFVRWL
jgi:hypothetical protein